MNAIAIAEEIKKRRRSGCTLFVGLDGLGGAGKSTASEEIKNILDGITVDKTLQK